MRNFFVIFLFFLSMQTANSQIDSLLSIECKRKIDSTYAALIEKNKVVGASIALVKDGKIIYTNGFGYQDREKLIKANENTIYRIGSCTKSMTAISILQLQEKGLLDIQNPIQNYLPELNVHSRFDEKNEIYIRSILAHTSGLPSDLYNGFFCDSPPNAQWSIEQLNKCTMALPSDYMQSYSNIGYGILGELISRSSHLSYSAYIKENIFDPLHMTSSFLDDGTYLSSNMSLGYVNKDAIQETQIRDQAAGLVASSVIDMGAYLNMLLAKGRFNEGNILSEKSVDAMQASYTKNITLPSSGDWGLGLYSKEIAFAQNEDTTLVTIIGHGGDTWAFHADFKYIPEYNVGAVILTNTDRGTRVANAQNLLKIYLEEMEGKKYIQNFKKDTTKYDQEDFCTEAEIIGEYFISGIEIHVKNPKKIKFNQGPHRIVLSPTSEHLTYKGKVRLFKVIPVKLKGQEFKFVKLHNEIYLKGKQTKTGLESYQGVKNQSGEITATWKNRIGKYELVDEAFDCEDCPYFNFKGLTMTLKVKKDKLVLKLKADDKSVGGESTLNVISDVFCVTPGIGRGSGDTFRVLENGNIFYQGFEFKRTN